MPILPESGPSDGGFDLVLLLIILVMAAFNYKLYKSKISFKTEILD